MITSFFIVQPGVLRELPHGNPNAHGRQVGAGKDGSQDQRLSLPALKPGLSFILPIDMPFCEINKSMIFRFIDQAISELNSLLQNFRQV